MQRVWRGSITVGHWSIFWITVLLISASLLWAGDYRINNNDVLDVTVYDHPEMTATVRVDGYGMVVLPLLNQVQIQGKTISEASAYIASLLADGYIVNPQVNIFVKNFRDRKAAILGQVSHPGVYDLGPKTTLLELISQAGGLTEEAGDRLTLKREVEKEGGAESQKQIVEVPLRQLVDQGDTSLNLPIQDGDKVFIEKAGLFYVTGQVRKPDSYRLQDHMTVIKAIARAGGFTDIAAKGSINVVRKHNGQREEIKDVDMDFLVQADDVIVVPESFF